jgi:hypothetical protein
MKTMPTQSIGGEAKITPSLSSEKNQTASFPFQSTRQMDRSDLLQYISELEAWIRNNINMSSKEATDE